MKDNIQIVQTVPSLSKNEYIALELTRCWAVGLPNRHYYSMNDVRCAYRDALNYLNEKEKEND